MSKKLLIKTWGCQMNEYDSSKMADLLNATNGYELTEEQLKQMYYSSIPALSVKKRKKKFSTNWVVGKRKDKKQGVVIGVGGCVATQEGDHIRERAPLWM